MPDKVQEFRAALAAEPLEKVLEERVLGGHVFAFNKDQAALQRLRDQLAIFLQPVTTLEVLVVGSAKTGFSMDPKRPFHPFHAKSDIDLALVSPDLFDTAWQTLLTWNYGLPEKTWPRKAAGPWVGERRDELWWGYLRPADWGHIAHKLGVLKDPAARKGFNPIRDMSTKWFNTFKQLARDRALSMRDVNGRLYRTREHATLYHADSLMKLRDAI